MLVLSLVVIPLAACNLGARRPTATDSVAVPSESTEAPASIDPTLPAAQVPAGPPPPAGLIEVLYAGVETGAWTYEQGLLEALRVFTGEFDPQGTWPELPASFEGTGLIHEAQRYLREGTDSETRAGVERLLDVIAPPVERLLEAAEPEPVAMFKPRGYAARRAISEDCAKMYADGFPKGSNLICLLYKESGIGGQTLRVFYPLVDMPLDYGDAAMTGMLQSFQVFSKLSASGQAPQMKGVDLLFVVLPAIEEPGTLAMVPSTSTDDRCLIVVYLGAIQDNELNKSGADDYGRFLQTIAHEMFHCYQVWNFPAHADDSWTVQDWWGEGTAEYFSNVVYPELNNEWEWTDDFTYRSADTPLTEMAYENTIFFQYLASQQGNASVLNLIKAMPVGGGLPAQATALAGVPGIQALFHDFGRAFMDQAIVDTGKQVIPVLPIYVQPDHKITVKEANIRLLEADPFVLSRYALTFTEGRSYTISRQLQGAAEGYDAARLDTANGIWSEMPATVIAGCGPVTYYALLTNASSNGVFAVETSMVPDEELGCDECLLGTWDLDVPTYVDNLTALVPSDESNQFNVDFAGGLWRIKFTKEALFTGSYNFVTLYNFFQANAPLGNDIKTDVKLTIEGEITSLYTADGVGHMSLNLQQDNLEFGQLLIMNGEEIPVDQEAFSNLFEMAPGASSTVTYSCDEDTLYLNFAPETPMLPLKYNRAD